VDIVVKEDSKEVSKEDLKEDSNQLMFLHWQLNKKKSMRISKLLQRFGEMLPQNQLLDQDQLQNKPLSQPPQLQYDRCLSSMDLNLQCYKSNNFYLKNNIFQKPSTIFCVSYYLYIFIQIWSLK
jgi:hypothetical protein